MHQGSDLPEICGFQRWSELLEPARRGRCRRWPTPAALKHPEVQTWCHVSSAVPDFTTASTEKQLFTQGRDRRCFREHWPAELSSTCRGHRGQIHAASQTQIQTLDEEESLKYFCVDWQKWNEHHLVSFVYSLCLKIKNMHASTKCFLSGNQPRSRRWECQGGTIRTPLQNQLFCLFLLIDY